MAEVPRADPSDESETVSASCSRLDLVGQSCKIDPDFGERTAKLVHRLTNREPTTALFVRKVAWIRIVRDEPVFAASRSFNCTKVAVRLEHLGHIALSAVPMPALDDFVGGCLAQIGVRISPVAKAGFYVLDSHPYVVK